MTQGIQLAPPTPAQHHRLLLFSTFVLRWYELPVRRWLRSKYNRASAVPSARQAQPISAAAANL